MADREMEIKPGLWLVWDNMNLSLEEEVENTAKNAKNAYVRRKVAGYSNNLGDLLCSYERNKFMALDCTTLQEMTERQKEIHKEVMELCRSYKIKDLWRANK